MLGDPKNIHANPIDKIPKLTQANFIVEFGRQSINLSIFFGIYYHRGWMLCCSLFPSATLPSTCLSFKRPVGRGHSQNQNIQNFCGCHKHMPPRILRRIGVRPCPRPSPRRVRPSMCHWWQLKLSMDVRLLVSVSPIEISNNLEFELISITRLTDIGLLTKNICLKYQK